MVRRSVCWSDLEDSGTLRVASLSFCAEDDEDNDSTELNDLRGEKLLEALCGLGVDIMCEKPYRWRENVGVKEELEILWMKLALGEADG